MGGSLSDPPPPMTIIEEGSGGVESTLNKLDEAVSMLASLHGHPQSRGRRGKIDLAALVWEVAPEAWEAQACRVAGREMTAREWRDRLPKRSQRPVCPGT